jgi:serine/threonine protein kinase
MDTTKDFLPNQQLTIGDRTYRFTPHPAPIHKNLPIVYAQQGAKGITFQLQDIATSQLYALKVLYRQYRTPWMAGVTRRLAQYQHVPGLEAAARRCLTRRDFPEVIKAHPELEYAILMPWLEGILWAEIIQARQPLMPPAALTLALLAAKVLRDFEQRGIAHTDIAGNNTIIRPGYAGMSLVDIEDLYAPGWPKPHHISTGTAGYQHRAGRRNGQWCPEGDRFAGAVLIAEMLSWSAPAVRNSVAEDADSIFSEEECQDPGSERFRIVINALEHRSPAIARLFTRAWHSPTLADCPLFSEWYEALQQLLPPRQPQPAPPITALAPAPTPIVKRWRKIELSTTTASPTPATLQPPTPPRRHLHPPLLYTGGVIFLLIIIAIVVALVMLTKT